MLSRLYGLSNVQQTGSFGTYDVPLIGLILAASLMYIGPAMGVWIYFFVQERRKAFTRPSSSMEEGKSPQKHQKAA